MIFVLRGLPVNFILLGEAMRVGVVIGAPLAALLLLCFSVHVEPWGIRSVNSWGLPRSVRWREIERVRCVRFCGLPFLVGRRLGGLERWIICF